MKRKTAYFASGILGILAVAALAVTARPGSRRPSRIHAVNKVSVAAPATLPAASPWYGFLALGLLILPGTLWGMHTARKDKKLQLPSEVFLRAMKPEPPAGRLTVSRRRGNVIFLGRQ